ncbi:MAG: hypothetical protein NC123_09465 [Butyrivibrio sp.]|nr:hypothetical protein [Acetatifactor muris]MCM1559763.1 hypothetical protein [Butyrivibrio sp.]
MKNQGKRLKMTAGDIALAGVMAAVMVVCKEVLSFLPNIELVSFWVIMFTLSFGWRILFAVPVFVLIEGCLYGMGLWWIMYLYAWPLLALAAYLNRRQESVWFWSLLSAFYGLFFGLLCAIPYVVIGITDRGIRGGLYAGFTWWVAGIRLDVVHCIGNFVLMSVLYHPVRNVMRRVSRKS